MHSGSQRVGFWAQQQCSAVRSPLHANPVDFLFEKYEIQEQKNKQYSALYSSLLFYGMCLNRFHSFICILYMTLEFDFHKCAAER